MKIAKFKASMCDKCFIELAGHEYKMFLVNVVYTDSPQFIYYWLDLIVN